MQFGRLTVLPPASKPLPAPTQGTPTPSCEMRMSADGRTLVYLATTLSGVPAALWREDPIVVRVYRDGALIAAHRLSDVATEEDLSKSAYDVRWARWVGSTRGPAVVVETRRGAYLAVSFSTGALILDETPAA